MNLVLCRDIGTPLPNSTFLMLRGNWAYLSRHTHVMLLEDGSDMKFVQERLCHGSMQITSDEYAHVSKKIAARSIDKFDE